MSGLNPFDWYGPQFLALYALLFAAALLMSFVIANALRSEGREMPVSDEEELAVLAGGRDRLTETVLARMLSRGSAMIEKSRIYLRQPAGGLAGAELALGGISNPVSWGKVRRALADKAEVIEQNLISRQLMMPRGEARAIGFLVASPFLGLIGFGLVKYQIGGARERPVGFLVLFMAITAFVGLSRWLAFDRKTKAGIAAVQAARKASARLKRAPMNEETGVAVALFGTAVLAGSPIDSLHRLRQSDGGSSGGDGGSGCGGGGCGGCGG